MICPKCGHEASGNFCSNCGATLGAAPAAAAQPSAATSPAPAVAAAPSPASPAPEAGTRTPAPEPTPSPVPQAPSPDVPALHAAACPVCREGVLAVRDAKGLLHTRHELVCDRCGAVLVEDKDDSARFTLSASNETSLPAWPRYKHQSLTAAEWQRIAAGGASDAEQAESDLADHLAALRAGRVRLTPPASCPVLLKAGEAALFVFDGIGLREPRAVHRGAYGGPSIHVAKGVTLRVGGFQAESHEELREIDAGSLTLTDKRLVFSGKLRSLDAPLAKLLSVDAYSDAVAVRRSGREKTEFFFGLDRYSYSFSVDGRSRREKMSGLILKYAIEGALAQG